MSGLRDRFRRSDAGGDGEEWPEEGTAVALPPLRGTDRRRSPRARATGAPSAPLPTQRAGAALADATPEAGPRPSMQGNEVPLAYVMGALLTVAGVLMLTITTGKGAPAHVSPIWPALTVAFGIATLVSIRWMRRIPTAILAILGGFLGGQARTPTSLAGVRLVALVGPMAFGLWLFLRDSRAERNRRTETLRAERAAKRAAGIDPTPRRRGVKTDPAPQHPKASKRYTPPKAPAKPER